MRSRRFSQCAYDLLLKKGGTCTTEGTIETFFICAFKKIAEEYQLVCSKMKAL